MRKLIILGLLAGLAAPKFLLALEGFEFRSVGHRGEAVPLGSA